MPQFPPEPTLVPDWVELPEADSAAQVEPAKQPTACPAAESGFDPVPPRSSPWRSQSMPETACGKAPPFLSSKMCSRVYLTKRAHVAASRRGLNSITRNLEVCFRIVATAGEALACRSHGLTPRELNLANGWRVRFASRSKGFFEKPWWRRSSPGTGAGPRSVIKL